MLQRSSPSPGAQSGFGSTSRRSHQIYINAFWTAACGLALGLAATWAALDAGYGFGPLVAGPWTAWPQTGGPEIDPYARAAFAQRGEAPLARELGVAFVARTDSSGAPLNGHCDYLIRSPVPPARFWTLSLLDLKGAPPTTDTQRYAYTSAEILRREGGGFEIEVARSARPGNWLSPGNARAFKIALRLYDISIDAAAKLDASAFPSIVRQECA